jgi:cell wall-associated NlpC family hydrolase
MTTVIPEVGSYNPQPRTQQYAQLQAINNNPLTATANSTVGQPTGAYDYASAIQDRLKSIGQLGTNANALQQQRLAGQQGSAAPANYNVGGPFKGDLSQSNAERNAIVRKAESYRGMWYKWGGASPSTSFDCSGLVQYVYGRFGIHLPRISNQQAMVGRTTSLANLKPGDLVAWDNSSRNKGADHIAIYVGGGMVMEAAHTGSQLRVRKLGRNEGAWGVSLSQYLG